MACDIEGPRAKKFRGQDSALDAMLQSMALPVITKRFAEYGRDNAISDGSFFSNLPIDELEDEVDEYGPKIAVTLSHQSADLSKVRCFKALSVMKAVLDALLNSIIVRTQDRSLNRDNWPESTSSDVWVVNIPTGRVKILDFNKLFAVLKSPTKSDDYTTALSAARRGFREALSEIPPAEVIRANARAAEFVKRVPHIGAPRRNAIKRRYQMISVPYTGISAVRKAQEILGKEVPSILGIDQFEREGELPPATDERFDAVRRSRIAIANEVIYTFPFLLPQTRTAIWGIVPYAFHTKIGVALSKNCEAYRTLIERSKMDNEIHNPRGQIATVWLQELFRFLDKDSRQIYAVEGYMLDEIVPLLIRGLSDERAEELFISKASKLPPVRQVQGRPGDSFVKLDQTVAERLRDGDAVAFIDLADKHLYESAFAPLDVDVLSFHHGMKIPVGVGFSLLLANAISSDRRWLKIRDAITDTLRADQPQLAEIGLVLN